MLRRKRYHHIMYARTVCVNRFNGRKPIKQQDARWNCQSLGKNVPRWALYLEDPRNSRLLPVLPRSEKQQPLSKTHQSDVTLSAGLDYFPKTRRKVLGILWEICHRNDFPQEAISDSHLMDHPVRCWGTEGISTNRLQHTGAKAVGFESIQYIKPLFQ